MKYRYNFILITLLVLVLVVGVPVFFIFTTKNMGHADSLFRIQLPIFLGLFSISEYFSRIVYQKSKITRKTPYNSVAIKWEEVIRISYKKFPFHVSLYDTRGKRMIINISVVKRYELLENVIYSLKKHCKNEEVLRKIKMIEKEIKF